MNNSRIRLKIKASCLKQKNKVFFTRKNVVTLFMVYELDTWSRDLDIEFPSYFIYIHKYLMKKIYEIMFRLIKKIFMDYKLA